MISNAGSVEMLAEHGRDEGSTEGFSNTVEYRIQGGQPTIGIRRTWVVPWLMMSNSAMFTCQCDGYALITV